MENRGKIGYAFSTAMLVCGIAIIVVGTIRILEPWITGIGAGLTAMGGLFLYKSLRYEKDPEYARKVDVSNTDERLSFVSGKAAMWTFQMSVMGLAILSVVLIPLGFEEAARTLGLTMAAITALYWVSYFTLIRRY